MNLLLCVQRLRNLLFFFCDYYLHLLLYFDCFILILFHDHVRRRFFIFDFFNHFRFNVGNSLLVTRYKLFLFLFKTFFLFLCLFFQFKDLLSSFLLKLLHCLHMLLLDVFCGFFHGLFHARRFLPALFDDLVVLRFESLDCSATFLLRLDGGNFEKLHLRYMLLTGIFGRIFHVLFHEGGCLQ